MFGYTMSWRSLYIIVGGVHFTVGLVLVLSLHKGTSNIAPSLLLGTYTSCWSPLIGWKDLSLHMFSASLQCLVVCLEYYGGNSWIALVYLRLGVGDGMDS